jgi:hypothetical protein
MYTSSELKNDFIPPRLNVAGCYIMPDIGSIDGGGPILTCDIAANDITSISMSDVENYCSLAGFENTTGSLKNSPAGYVWVHDREFVKESSSILKDVLISLYSSMLAIDGLSIFKDISILLASKTVLSDEFDLIADKELAISEFCSLVDTLKININGLPDHTGGTAWVINIETGAVSLFLDYDFNSFIPDYTTNSVYGVCSDGIYKLTANDSAVPLSAVDYGIHRFGSEQKKMIPNFYASVASTGRVILKLLVGNNEYEYFAMSSSEHLDKHRIDIGKGIGLGNRFIYANPIVIAPDSIEIKELDSLEYVPVVFDRRK